MIKIALFSLTLWSIALCGGEVVFIVTADLHGNLDNLSRLAPQMISHPDAVKVDLGDIVQGDYPLTDSRAEPMLECFNFLGYDILIPGNHDLEFPEKTLLTWQRIFKGKIMGAQWSLGNFRMPGFAVIRRGKYRIGILALGAVGLKRHAEFFPRLRYQDEVAALKEAVTAAGEAPCDAYLLMGHIGAGNFGVLSGILDAFPEVNAVVGAHSHREVPGGRMRGILAVQPGAHGESAVKLTLVFDENRRLKYIRSALIVPGSVPDAGIGRIARNLQEKYAVRQQELLAEFASAEKFGAAAAEIIRQVSGAEAAIIGIDCSRFVSRVTRQVLFDMLPYGNRIAVVTLPRKTVMGLLRKRKNSPVKYFGAGDFSKAYIKVAVSDFLLSRMKEPPPAEIGDRFERIEIEKSLNMRNFDRE